MADWSQLPKELLGVIAKRLESPFYRLRLRSVCSSWRSSVSSKPYKGHNTSIPLDGHVIRSSPCSSSLERHTIFLITTTQTPPNSTWLTKIEENPHGLFTLRIPLSRSSFQRLDFATTNNNNKAMIDLFNFKVVDLGHEYVLRYMEVIDNYSNAILNEAGTLGTKKVAYMCLGSEFETEGFALLTIHVSGSFLAMFKSEDKRWSKIAYDLHSLYHDVVLFRDEFYAVDGNGRTVHVGLSSSVSLVAGRVFSGGGKKYLVESDGQLLLVDMYLSFFPDVSDDEVFYGSICNHRMWFKVYKLDWEGKRWVEVESLGDRVLFLGDDYRFSASALELSGCKGNCIFFSNKYLNKYFYGGDGVFRDIGVCDLDNRSVKPLTDYPEYSKLFWPPPDWAVSTTSGVPKQLEELHT